MTVSVTEWLGGLPEELFEVVSAMDTKTIKMLNGLNHSQLRAVLTVEGPVQINAVAGSGKTKVLTTRAAYMVNTLKIKPANILLTTFTKKASEEMKERLGKLIPKMSMMQMTIGTTHSIGYRILKKEYTDSNHHLAGAFRKKMLINLELKKFAESVKKAIIFDRTVPFSVKEAMRDIPTPSFLKVVSSCMGEGKDASQFEQENANNGGRAQAYVEFYSRYEQMKWSECRIDTDDLLFLLVRLFEENPDILAKYQKQYQYLMVDESQDNNAQQYKLTRMLGKPNYNLFYVGDDDQSMYGFRGAKPEEFIYLRNNYKGLQQINLEDNYRSNPGILDVANKLIAFNTERLVKKLRAHKQDTSQAVAFSKYQDERDEAQGTVQEIKILHEEKGIEYKDIAILYRTNAQSRAMEEELIIQGLPYYIWGGVSFYQRKEVKDIISYLQMVIDEHNDTAFERVINVPSRYLGKAYMDKVRAFSGSHWEAITTGSINFKPYEVKGNENFVDLITRMKALHAEGASPTDLVEFLMVDCYEEYLKEEGEDEDDGTGRLENIATLKFALGRYEKVEDFLDYIHMMTEEAKDGVPTGVQLMTIHKSKGLEFPVCFVIGMSSNLLPHFKSIEAYNDGKELAIEEERRLAYVAVTRAESFCYVSSPQSFNGSNTPTSEFVFNMGLVTKEEIMKDADIEEDPMMEAFIRECDEEYREMQRQEMKAYGVVAETIQRYFEDKELDEYEQKERDHREMLWNPNTEDKHYLG
jgi:DNA helicase II / ATP-dependent DNA helicase PcrA